MKFEDTSQNLRSRLWIVQSLVVLLLALLGVRLYYLQLVRGQYYAEVAQNQRIRLLPIRAPRGDILANDGKTALANSNPIYNVILSREDLRDRKLASLVKPLAEALAVDSDILQDRFEQIGSQPAFESILVKQDATPGDIAWVEAHELEFPELRVEQQPQRRYPANGMLAHVLGYVGEISPEQLKQPAYKDKGLKPGDVIGQSGLEQTYDDYLRGKDGYRKVIVDSRGRIQDEIAIVPPQPGQDLVSTIDLDLQKTAEDQLRKSPQGRGVVIVMNPNNGEILALASAPTFDPNLFSRMGSKEGRAEYAALLNDPKKPLINRAIQGRYPPGSTWKPLMATAGLQQGVISIDDSNLVCGGGITIGNKFTRCMGGNHGSPNLHVAIMKSCDAYFYRLGLKMKLEGIQAMADEFDLNKRTGIDLPQEVVSTTPSRELKARLYPRDPDWKDIDTVYSSFGQGQDVLTPIALLRAHSAIAMGGRMYVPHLLKEIRPVAAVGDDPTSPDYRQARLARSFDRPEPKILPIPKDQNEVVVKAMWSVVNEAGTATGIKIAGFDIAGKTGTAQVVSLGKDVGEHKDHSWFVSYAPAFKPEISCVALIENAGLGSRFGAPTVRAIYDVYYQKTRNEAAPGALPVAKTPRLENKTPKKPETQIARNQ
ncbi:MAG TPA: penicillin-binding protein 2 [Blastocatellia bacterium]|jgi:penicillin-binding protein 2|nr:penicillin-binding protein 2 [Blastocatellia bacterium]HAF24711.1 penicillin-binding protein 2 [Blastocatellia bacterium]HCX30092.1 penicillin-binding protein 2 [Blastocatellia bacterium]